MVLLNGDESDARAWGLDGVHWTAARLATAAERPVDLVCAASCHTAAEVARAGALALDFAVLGPVRPTPSHPGAPAMGFDGFARAVDGTTLPVYALGGLAALDLPAAIDAGAHGVASMRGAWPPP